MDLYILFIWNDTIIDQKKLVEDYLMSLLPSTEKYKCALYLANEIAFLMKPNSVHTAILSKLANSENIEWSSSPENFNIKDILSSDLISQDSGNEITSKDFTEQICESIHSLADQLPAFGTYKLNVLISCDVIKDVSVSKDTSLAGAFYRLTRWHSAHFAILIENELDKTGLEEWCEVMNADVLEENCVSDLGPSLWRGSIQFDDSKASENTFFEGLEMKLDLTENEDYFFLYEHLKREIKEENCERIVLSPKMHIDGECSFASIPPYMISPLIFRLHLGKPNLLNEKSTYFLNYLSNKSEAAMIVRLSYAKINDSTKGEKKYCTSRWRKSVSSGCIRDAEPFIISFEDFITFAVTKSEKSHHIIAFPFRDSKSLDPKFYFHLINQRLSKQTNIVPAETKENNAITNIFKEIPIIETSLFYKIIERLKKLNVQLLKNGNSSFNTRIYSEISFLWKEAINASKGILCNNQVYETMLEEIDPSDWPERIYWLGKQMQNEEEKKLCIPNAK